MLHRLFKNFFVYSFMKAKFTWNFINCKAFRSFYDTKKASQGVIFPAMLFV